jgi:hypothetical protein
MFMEVNKMKEAKIYHYEKKYRGLTAMGVGLTNAEAKANYDKDAARVLKELRA